MTERPESSFPRYCPTRRRPWDHSLAALVRSPLVALELSPLVALLRSLVALARSPSAPFWCPTNSVSHVNQVPHWRRPTVTRCRSWECANPQRALVHCLSCRVTRRQGLPITRDSRLASKPRWRRSKSLFRRRPTLNVPTARVPHASDRRTASSRQTLTQGALGDRLRLRVWRLAPVAALVAWLVSVHPAVTSAEMRR